MTSSSLLAAIAVMAILTAATRFVPFLVFSKKETPEVIVYLGKYLPYAIMGMLVVFCMKNVTFTSINNFMPELIASAVVVGTYVFKKNTLASIIIGTVCYMILVQFVFI